MQHHTLIKAVSHFTIMSSTVRYRIFTLDRTFRPLNQKVEIAVYVRTYFSNNGELGFFFNR